ncbi:ATP-binding protein [Quadrisphaera sp. DSM 44207]|uniref:ATP-binding protein n=1 Tax=Quadrisphaera sp. DSM 44207 TaxID=1881057 RepID=UPI00088C5CD5|nr:ATP-binding protein [Quadrisphaera sp. DSM 44207]SDQ37236.1 Anti-sigma regulatory factor (Ser/Thr protein kinase) [Quadrisphaera sp. DSM 44207]
MELAYGLRLPTDVRYVSLVRRLLVTTLEELLVEADCVGDVALAITEACANVVKHAGSLEDFEIAVQLDGTVCRITVVDHGVGYRGPGAQDGGATTGPAGTGTAADPGSGSSAGAEAAAAADALEDADLPDADPLTHGRGIGLMELLVDQLHFVPDVDGTTLVLVKNLRVQPGSILLAA